MPVSSRLPAPFGAWIDRSAPLAFRFDGRDCEGLAGDCIASALAANGEWLLSRSFKYHRARGILSMAGQDANTLVQLPAAPNALADREPLTANLDVRGQNYSGTLRRDRNRWIGLLARFLPVGFYYKAFFRPRGIWEFWARLIRRSAGLGVIDTGFLPTGFDKRYLHCDLAVIGGGPAGMQAALAAAGEGAQVLLVEEHPHLGGSLNYARFDVAGALAATERERLCAAVSNCERIHVLRAASCNGWHVDHWLAVVQDRCLYKVRATATLLCTGSIEQLACFRNNDLPGIMMGSAAQRLMRQYGVAPGRQAVVLTGNEDGYAVALDLAEAGVEVLAIVELRPAPPVTEMASAATQAGLRVVCGHTVFAARAGSGGRHLAAVEIRPVTAVGQCGPKGETIACDLLCMAVGYMPAYQLACQAGAILDYDDEQAAFSLRNLPRNMHLAGSVNGTWDLTAVCREAEASGTAALADNDASIDDKAESRFPKSSVATNFPWPIFPHPDGKEFVDLDEDLQIADIVNATRDGYEDVQLLKRYSTCGMGPSQGRHSALPTARIVAKLAGRTVAQTGITTARPPFAPELIAHNAGRSYFPARRSGIHHRHLEAGAWMMQAGAWYRPAWYGPQGAGERCVRAEAQNVRSNVGLIDVSTLGGIEIRGPSARAFLDRVYTGAFTKLVPGKARYALMINEAGIVIDDGVLCCLAPDHYYVTATTGGVDAVVRALLRWNAMWGMDVDIANVTAAWCGINVAGPRSRLVLAKLCTDVALDDENFPFMAVRRATVAGIPVRLLRAGFVGELGFEVHAPQSCAEALWDALMQAGNEFGLAPFGVEAQRLLRLEKGHVIIGQDTDAMSTPAELQMHWAVADGKPYFVGQRSLRELGQRLQRRKLVGFALNPESTRIPLESHLVMDADRMIGRVTSCAYSPALGYPIGLAYVPADLDDGCSIQIQVDDGQRVLACIVPTPFYDALNGRQRL